MDLVALARFVRQQTGVSPDWDGVIADQLADYFRRMGYAPEPGVSPARADIAEAVANVARRIATERHHQRYP